ncbi:hypothetical protein QYE76_067804 [Lolium multiflorum]|uniref:Uncharacterized protein n=1 Tax=Lolium multiflorum TaxID=4521 RepID=A0AAD8WDB5_LOLMU|nr:hypothetical protein QYE76_067804 [Lolium multiflorum]
MATPTLRLQQPLHRTEAAEALNHGDISKCTTSDRSPTDTYDPWDPPRPPPHPSIKALTSRHQFNMQYSRQIWNFLAQVRGTSIIVPDRTSQGTMAMFVEIHARLVAILKKDSVPSFQRMFVKYRECMVCGYVITPQTLQLIIAMNALRCAKFVLEGTAPKLGGQRANPNYITSFGFFPLHQAAETFSADMVELLLNYGALPNLRTSGDRIIEGLLPLHVAIENTCQHKYLEDNLLSDQSHMKGNVEYIYKLIYLLCLPEMKIFMDTTRVLASQTDNIVDELWDYIKHGKLVPAAILLLAAQRHLRNLGGFDRIQDLIDDSNFSLAREECGLESGKNTKAQKQLKEKKAQFSNAFMLVRIILNAGEALDAYIQTHSKASHEEVLGKVSAILQNYDVGPSGKAAIKEPRKGQNLYFARDQFLPMWRSVLTCRFLVSFFPSYAPKKESLYARPVDTKKKVNNQRPCQVGLGLLDTSRSWKSRKDPKVSSAPRSRRLFATAASTVLKMLKRS